GVDHEADGRTQHGFERAELQHAELGAHIGEQHAAKRKHHAHDERDAREARRQSEQALLHPPPSSPRQPHVLALLCGDAVRNCLYKIRAKPSALRPKSRPRWSILGAGNRATSGAKRIASSQGGLQPTSNGSVPVGLPELSSVIFSTRASAWRNSSSQRRLSASPRS